MQRIRLAEILLILAGLLVIIEAGIEYEGASFIQHNPGALQNLTYNATTIAKIRASVPLLYDISILGLVCGILILITGYMVTKKNRKLWAILGLVLSLVSFGAGGGFIIGVILGIVGSVIAYLYQ